MQYDSILIVKDIVIAVAAFVGMGLGFLNFWNEKQKESKAKGHAKGSIRKR